MFRSLFELLIPRGNGFNSLLLSDRGQKQYLLATLHHITAFTFEVFNYLLLPSEPLNLLLYFHYRFMPPTTTYHSSISLLLMLTYRTFSF